MANAYTSNYKLDLYTDNDKPNLRDQYNGAMNKIDSQLNTLSNNIVISTEAANQAKEQAKAASDSAATNAQSIATLNNTVSDIDTAYKAADSAITDAYKAADSTITNAYKAADTNLSENLTAAYKAADTNLSDAITAAYKAADREIETAYKAADSTLAAHFPIRSDDIAAGAITRDKLDAQALESLIKGITIRRFDSNDNAADNAGLIVPNGGYIAGFYLPELTMLVITRFESINYGQSIEEFRNHTVTEFKLPDYIPHITAPFAYLNSFGIIYTAASNFVTWTGVGLTRDGYLGVGAKIFSADNRAFSMAGNAVCFLRAFGAA